MKKVESTRITINRARLSYAHLFKPHAMNPGQEAKYSVALLIDKKNELMISQIEQAIELAILKGQEKFQWKGSALKNLTLPLHDGDVDKEEDTNYAGTRYLNAKNTRKPKVFNEYKDEVVDESEVYSGCYAKAVVNFYPYDMMGKRGIGVSLEGIMKIEDGDPLGGGKPVTLADFEDDDDAFLGA